MRLSGWFVSVYIFDFKLLSQNKLHFKNEVPFKHILIAIFILKHFLYLLTFILKNCIKFLSFPLIWCSLKTIYLMLIFLSHFKINSNSKTRIRLRLAQRCGADSARDSRKIVLNSRQCQTPNPLPPRKLEPQTPY